MTSHRNVCYQPVWRKVHGTSSSRFSGFLPGLGFGAGGEDIRVPGQRRAAASAAWDSSCHHRGLMRNVAAGAQAVVVFAVGDRIPEPPNTQRRIPRLPCPIISPDLAAQQIRPLHFGIVFPSLAAASGIEGFAFEYMPIATLRHAAKLVNRVGDQQR